MAIATYEVLQRSFINGRLVEAGETVEFDGPPGPNLRAVDTAAKKAFAALPPDPVARLMTAVKLAAATRGAEPSEVSDQDMAAALAEMAVKPDQSIIDDAAVRLGIAKTPAPLV